MKLKLNRSRIILAALLGIAAHNSNAAAPVSPILTNAVGWDLLISGKNSEQGIVYLTFASNNPVSGTFDGVLAVTRVAVPKKAATGRSTAPSDRNPGSSTLPITVTNVLAFLPISGLWSYDSKGYTVGFFAYEVAAQTSTTTTDQNIVSSIGAGDPNFNKLWYRVTDNYYTNGTTFWITNNNSRWVMESVDSPNAFTNSSLIGFYQRAANLNDPPTVAYLQNSSSTADYTNQISFKAKIKANKSLTASYSSSAGGSGTYKGVPIKTVTNLAGFWTATEKNSTLTTYEAFSVTPLAPWPNVYEVLGSGPGYGLEGYCIVSSQKKIFFAGEKNSAISRYTVGPFSTSRTAFGGKTKGVQDVATNIVTLDAFRVSP